MEKEDKSLIEDLKIAIIYGKEAVDGENKDGIVEKIYKDEDDTAHYFYMKEFLENHFVQEKVLNKKHDVNSIFYEMQKMGHIVFAENTSTEKYKTGIFYIPKSISDKQKESLKIMQEQLEKEDYNITELFNLHRDEDGILLGNQIQGKANILNQWIEEEREL